MLFNSPEFIFGFVPLTLLGFFLLARFSQMGARQLAMNTSVHP